MKATEHTGHMGRGEAFQAFAVNIGTTQGLVSDGVAGVEDASLPSDVVASNIER